MYSPYDRLRGTSLGAQLAAWLAAHPQMPRAERKQLEDRSDLPDGFWKMRMWGLPVDLMCNMHLIGEHNEMHGFIGCINASIGIDGYVVRGLVDIRLLEQRHNELATEMSRRGFRHLSPLHRDRLLRVQELIKARPDLVRDIDKRASLQELWRRCPSCRKIWNDRQRQKATAK